FKIRVNKHHPNIWHFINCLKQEEVYFRYQVIQTGRPRTKKINRVQRRIDTLANHYENDEIKLEECLEGLSFVVAKDKRKKNDHSSST
ncbi:unnamed protein product, partial [Didymodactylos carnosus]